MNTETDKSKNSSKERSVAYPSITLSDAVDATSKLRETLGKGPYSREEAAKALGHAKLSGPASRKVAALVHYGLLERTGSAYVQTQLAQDILKPLSDEQKQQGIVTAVRTPRLFEKLLQKYAGQAVPTMLQNVLVREGVSESASAEVARLFTESIKFAGLFANGVVSVVPPMSDKQAGSEGGHSSVISQEQNIPVIRQTAKIESEIHSDNFTFEFNGGIKLVIPKNRSTSDAIADGELKKARVALNEFSEKFMIDEDVEEVE